MHTRAAAADVAKLKRTDIRDDALWIVQNKIGVRQGVEMAGDLAATIVRINATPAQGDQRLPHPGRKRSTLDSVRIAFTL